MPVVLRSLSALALCASLQAALPPLIDRDLFFGEVQISGAQISPDGKYISFLKTYKGTRNIWVKRAGEPFSAAKPMTSESKRPIRAYFWSRDARFLLYEQDQAGDENFNIYAVDATAAPVAEAEVPKARNITDAKGARTFIYALPKNDPDTIYAGLNDRDKAWPDLYKLRISTGARTLLRKNTERIANWTFDNAGTLRLATRTTDRGDTEVLRVDAEKFAPIYSCDVFETCTPVRFDSTNSKVYVITNKGANVDLTELGMVDPVSGAVTAVERDPLKRVDLKNAMFSDLSDQLVGTVYEDERERIYWKDPVFEADYKWLQAKLPGREIGFASHSKDENLWIISAHSDREPGETYLYDRKAKTLVFQYRIREQLPRQSLASKRSIRYKSSDGLEIPAYVTIPKGVEAKDLPLIVFPHGGPWARDEWGYDTFAQFFANRGYAVLQPNFRGSTGYGKKFLNAGNGEWGRKMQDDITWGVKYLVVQGIVNPKRVGIAGGSYGGYATLAGVAFTPDLSAAAVSIVGPSNLITLLNSIPPYWEADRKIMYSRMGDPGTPEGKKLLAEESPLNSAAQIKTPLMVVQGANDPRVNKRESDQIVVALRDRGISVVYLVAPDEGHGFARPINNLAMVAEMERFLGRHLDARFQESVPSDVAARLKQITVDPKTVRLAAKVDGSQVGTAVPTQDLEPGLSNYKATLEAGGQTIPLEMSSEIKDESGLWAATDTMQTPMGAVTDKTMIEKRTLIPRERHVRQGQVVIDLTYDQGKATGTMTRNGQQKAIQVDLGGPLFADSAGSMQSVAALPLADGYKTTFRNFDLQSQKAKLMQLSVADSESVTVPAGTFQAYKVDISSTDSAEKMTMWVAKTSKKTVKYQALLPQMGGATLTAELMP